MRLILGTITLGLSLLISGCLKTGARVSDSLQTVSAADGWIVGTIGAETGGFFERKGSIYTDNKLIFARLDQQGGKGGGTLSASLGAGFGIGKAFFDSAEFSDLFAIQLPSGTYAFVGAYFWQNKGQFGTSEVRTGFPAPITFTVKPGETLYLGSFIATNEWPEGFPLRTNPGQPYFTAFSRAGRDMPALRKAHPQLPAKLAGWAPEPANFSLRMPPKVAPQK